ncbi:hypothetical protein [Thalassotalea profundi]|uniref:Dienelactone hydrolase n=1 Tax=Thalassotalea profundi TaxID=2036687 RepID=A0ABQ3IEY6_9GAMM|nr:hypothetical protein [Thalassotalea profundi]GHE78644.1 dienelactone hydrolase [Thalassotalea profundi]
MVVPLNRHITKTVLVTDIFGVTPALNNLSKELGNALIIDPYQGKLMDFIDEQSAYDYFSKHIGLDQYLKLFQAEIKEHANIKTLIGFSVGATILWRYSATVNNLNADNTPRNNQHIIGFYGGQIRHFVDLHPQISIELIFPRSEPHFAINQLIKQLSPVKNVSIIHCDYKHGFMNSHSTNYNPLAYQCYLDKLRAKCQYN